jgi:plasmid segregation protein ParM
MSNVFIGLDVGRSSVKGVAHFSNESSELHSEKCIFPTNVAKARPIIYETLMPNARRDTVTFDGEDYWTGETALVQAMGAEPLGRSDSWILSKEHDVLVKAAVGRLMAQGVPYEPENAVVALGVPSRVFRERQDLVKALREATAKALSVGGRTPTVFVHAQPMGVIAAYTLEKDGFTREGRDLSSESYAVVDIGQYTTDLSAVVKGEPVIEATASCEGMELISNHLRRHLRTLDLELPVLDLESLLANPQLRARGETHQLKDCLDEAIADVLVPKIITAVTETFNPVLLQSVDTILIAGGGAPVVFEALKKHPKLSHANTVEEPRWSISEGFARLAALMHASALVGR